MSAKPILSVRPYWYLLKRILLAFFLFIPLGNPAQTLPSQAAPLQSRSSFSLTVTRVPMGNLPKYLCSGKTVSISVRVNG